MLRQLYSKAVNNDMLNCMQIIAYKINDERRIEHEHFVFWAKRQW